MSFSVLCRVSELLSLGVLLQCGFSLLLGAVLHADWVLFRECLMMVFKKKNGDGKILLLLFNFAAVV